MFSVVADQLLPVNTFTTFGNNTILSNNDECWRPFGTISKFTQNSYSIRWLDHFVSNDWTWAALWELCFHCLFENRKPQLTAAVLLTLYLFLKEKWVRLHQIYLVLAVIRIKWVLLIKCTFTANQMHFHRQCPSVSALAYPIRIEAVLCL